MTTPITQDTAILAMLAALRTISGLPSAQVYRSHGNATPGTGDRIAVTPIVDVRRGRATRGGGNLDTARRLTLQIDGYGWDAAQAVRDASSVLQTDGVASRALTAAGVSVNRIGSARDTSAVQTSTWEPRVTLDVVVGYIRRVETAGSAEAGAIVVNIRGREAPTIEVDADSVIEETP